MKISILLPSRNRPVEFERMWRSAINTADNVEDIEFIVYRDIDDHSEYKYPIQHRVVKGGRVVLSQMWNLCIPVAEGEIFMQCGDDIVFLTKGWDTLVRNAFEASPDKILFVHGDDGFWSSSFGTHGFVHRKWYEILGYFTPPFYSSDYGDTHINDIADILGRRMYLPFVTEHLHFLFGKSKVDSTYAERLERHKKDKPTELYNSPEMVKGRVEDTKKLLAVINKNIK